ncbi:MAG TPA: hypothetical protein VFS33_09185 [Gemmatimonadales bacterium]|nr:hypothetical protein [Gemmatimonadales bacterium]
MSANADRPDGSGCQGNLILFAACLLTLAAVTVLAPAIGWTRDRALWVGLGAALAMLTLTRPWWFWENYKARWLRGLVGDAATALLYLALAVAMVWIGLATTWTFGRR